MVNTVEIPANAIILEEEIDTTKRWMEYFERKYSVQSSSEEQEENEDSFYIHICNWEHTTKDEIRQEEMTEAIKKLKRGTSAEHDGIKT